MSRVALLEIHIARPEWPGALHNACLYDPDARSVVASTSAATHDAALEKIQTLKAHSKFARRRVVVKSNRPPVVLALLHLIDMSEHMEDLETGASATFLPIPLDAFREGMRNAIAAIEGGAA